MELRRVGAEVFADVLPLLLKFRNPRMSPDDWHRMLFSYPWPSERRHGYGYFSDGKLVGFLGTVFSRRVMAGRLEDVCSFSSWILDDAYRGTSVLMVRRLLADLEGFTIVGFTPAPTTCAVFGRFGFRPFETTRLLLPPPVSSVRALRGLRASVILDPDRIRARLAGPEAEYFRDTIGCTRVRHALLVRGSEQCYLVARLDWPHRIRAAELLYIGNPPFFWEHRGLAHLAFLRASGALGLIVDERLTGGRPVGLAKRLERVRVFRPARPDITPDLIDGLYSELVTLRE